jgi:ribokinase
MSRVYVAGSINMDVVARAPRHPAVGETVAGTSLTYHPGGKGANQAVAAARLGADCHLIGRLGGDSLASRLRRFLREMNVNVDNVLETAESPSGTALIVVADGANTIVVVGGANETLSATDTDKVEVAAGDVLVAQFETPADATRSFFSRGKAAGARTILNPAPAAPIDPDLLALCDFVVVNETEFARLSGKSHAAEIGGAEEIGAAVEKLRARQGQGWVVTLGAVGAVAFSSDTEPQLVEGHDVPTVDTTGAGDCFVGAFAAQLSAGSDPADALAAANAAAALCVQSHGAGRSMPGLTAVDELLGSA